MAVIGERTPVKQKGRDFWCCCPLHQEKTPSFKIDPATQLWHCFGCGEGGDVFSFIMKTEDFNFPEAVRYLADRAHIDIAEDMRGGGVSRSVKSRMKEICARTAEFYHTQLMRGRGEGPDAARKYLASRGFGGEVPKKWMLGYAPGRGALVRHLSALGFKPDEMIRANVALDGRGGPVRDRFYERVMFPIFDAQGDCVAFGGRVIGTGEPKYLNSQETPLFHKSQVLYGLNQAKARMASTGCAIVVEGYTDVIALHEAGRHQRGGHPGHGAHHAAHPGARQARAQEDRLPVRRRRGGPEGGRSRPGLHRREHLRQEPQLRGASWPSPCRTTRIRPSSCKQKARKPWRRWWKGRCRSSSSASSGASTASTWTRRPAAIARWTRAWRCSPPSRTRWWRRTTPCAPGRACGPMAVSASRRPTCWSAWRPWRCPAAPARRRPPPKLPCPGPRGARFPRPSATACASSESFWPWPASIPLVGLAHADALAQVQWHEEVHRLLAESVLATLSENPGAAPADIVTKATLATPHAARVLTAGSSYPSSTPEAIGAYLAEELALGDAEEAIGALTAQMNAGADAEEVELLHAAVTTLADGRGRPPRRPSGPSRQLGRPSLSRRGRPWSPLFLSCMIVPLARADQGQPLRRGRGVPSVRRFRGSSGQRGASRITMSQATDTIPGPLRAARGCRSALTLHYTE